MLFVWSSRYGQGWLWCNKNKHRSPWGRSLIAEQQFRTKPQQDLWPWCQLSHPAEHHSRLRLVWKSIPTLSNRYIKLLYLSLPLLHPHPHPHPHKHSLSLSLCLQFQPFFLASSPRPLSVVSWWADDEDWSQESSSGSDKNYTQQKKTPTEVKKRISLTPPVSTLTTAYEM